jgi:acyl-CoA thioesterase
MSEQHTLRAPAPPISAYAVQAGGRYLASTLTRGPWHPEHQHAGPPIALVCHAIERAAAEKGLTHISRLTANLMRPVPIGELSVQVQADYTGRNAGHFSAQLSANGKEVGRFTALAQREVDVALPASGHPEPERPRGPEESVPAGFDFFKPLPADASTPADAHLNYSHLVETRVAHGRCWKGPCAVWFRMRQPLLDSEPPSAYQRVAVAADSGNGISAILDFTRYTFLNSDLTINLLRRPRGEWICLDARTLLSTAGNGLAESTLFDAHGVIGRATQSLLVRVRD